MYSTLHCSFTVFFLSYESKVFWRFSVGTETKERSQVLGAFALLDFTMLRLILAGRAFWNLWTVNFFNFFSGRCKPRKLDQWIWGHDCIYIYIYIYVCVCVCVWGIFTVKWKNQQKSYIYIFAPSAGGKQMEFQGEILQINDKH
jgi:hypothetical protein